MPSLRSIWRCTPRIRKISLTIRVAISNPILEKVFLPIAPETTFVTYFGHLNGYDAGYYGYAWADAIAADMATVFESAKEGYLDKQAGMRLRRDIYEPGDSRDITQSIEKFLGRKQSVQPFLKKIGIGGAKKDEAGVPPTGNAIDVAQPVPSAESRANARSATIAALHYESST